MVKSKILIQILSCKLYLRTKYALVIQKYSLCYLLCVVTPGIMGKSIWSDHVSGSGEYSELTVFNFIHISIKG